MSPAARLAGNAIGAVAQRSRSIPWWKQTTVYQVYPRSFADKNGDGIGDLAGLIDRLDYLADLGVETLWLSPFYRSPQADFGYDISDHYDVAPEYGNRDDVPRLVEALHSRGMKLVLDMVLNHTSDRHPWFLDARAARDSHQRDWYLWKDGRQPGGRAPPNNWRSMIGGSGWRWDPATEQWYFATFLPFQPDLNWRNPAVKRAMLDVVRHWLALGVDGLRLDLFNALYKDASFADNPRGYRLIPREDNPHGFLQHHLHTLDHADTIGFTRELRAVTDEFSHPPRFLVGEVFGSPATLRRYCGEEGDGLHLVFLFKAMRTPLRAAAFRALLEEVEQSFPDPLLPTWVFANHDRPRAIDRLGGDARRAKLLAALQLTARGVPFIYYGDEIGMEHSPIAVADALDPIAARFRFVPSWLSPRLRRHGILLNRDECRRPMQWSAARHAGFSPPETDATWLPLHPASAVCNVAAQTGDPDSILSCYRRMLALRRSSAALSGGSLQLLPAGEGPRQLLSFRRTAGDETAHVVLNFSSRPVPLDPTRHAAAPAWSSLRDGVLDGEARRVLRPWEAIVHLEVGR